MTGHNRPGKKSHKIPTKIKNFLQLETGLKFYHPGLLFKLKPSLPPSFYLFFKSYLHKHNFLVRSGTEYRYSSISPILAGVPQSAVVSPTLINLYSVDQPTNLNTQVAEHADDKVIYFSHTNPEVVSTSLQNHLNDLSHWYSHCHIKINENSTHYLSSP